MTHTSPRADLPGAINRKRMIKAIVVALTLLLQTLLYGQQTLYSGRVIDALYGTPVPYASVFVDNTQIGAVADNVGEFSFQLPDSLRYRRLVGVGNGYSIAYFWPDQEDPSALLIELVPSETAQGTVSPLGGPPQKRWVIPTPIGSISAASRPFPPPIPSRVCGSGQGWPPTPASVPIFS